MKNRKGQISLGDAQQIVMIVGLVFLLMATLAYISYQYGDATRIPNTVGSAVNESITTTLGTGTLSANYLNDGSCGTITKVYNVTSGVVASGNYTQTGCVLSNSTQSCAGTTCAPPWKVNYPYTFSNDTVATTITDSLGTQINNNTSIAGIVLTISLVGIVLSVLIGVFVLVGRRKV